MDLITIDFETFYTPAYSLSKYTTEEYIRCDTFEVIGVSLQVNANEPVWFSGTMRDTEKFLKSYDWENSVGLAHNAMFDMAILGWRFGIYPKRIADTLCMGRALHGTEVGGSLGALATHYAVGVKGTEVLNALGKRRLDFTPTELATYGEYCKNDVTLTYGLFAAMVPMFPMFELRLVDLTLRMYTEPVLELDPQRLQAHVDKVREAKEKLLATVSVDKGSIMSNDKLAAVLRSLGVEPPTKISLTTGKEAYAFAKTDEDFKALLEHPDVQVQAVVAARLGVKSTLEETRTQRLINIHTRGKLPIPLRYYAAHTGRWGGDDKVNMQNLPRASALKHTILAPAGYVLIDSDSSQIEARTLAWLAEQNDLVEAFDRGEDVYKIMASAIYGKPVEEISKSERFVGKTTVLGCVGVGTQVLCETGWKPIEEVSLADRVWDGEEWVCHQGLQNSGIKETLNLCGVWLTPDHRVWSGTQWLEAQSVVADEGTLSQVLGTGAANLPSQATYVVHDWGSKPLSSGATATKRSTPLTTITSRTLEALGALYVPNAPQAQNDTGCTQMRWATTDTEPDCSTAYQRVFPGATTRLAVCTNTTGGAALQYPKSGGRTEPRFFSMYKHLKGGMSLVLKWTGLTSTATMSPATSGLYPEVTTLGTNEKLQTSNRKLQTYDLAYSGPRNRYTVLTSQGAVIVHNCGYGMGAAKFKAQLKTFGVDLPQEECERIISVYRSTYPRVPALWKQAGDSLRAIIGDRTAPIGREGALVVEGRKGIRLPNGLYIKYPNLRLVASPDDGKQQFVYDARKGKTTVPNKIYGGKVVENVCQALARIIIGEQMLAIAKRYKVAMTVHDAICCVVPEGEAQEGQVFIEASMRTRPTWALELPLNCESGVGNSYGEC